MKITVLNGSPKGDESVTMQYVQFIQKKFPQHELKILNISQKIKKLENDEKAFKEIIDEVSTSDGILWAFPIYILLVPSQYKRFIELIWERGVEEAFKGRYTAVLTTSARLFDHTAHRYMNAICDDLDMKYIDFFSADMNDMLKEEERDRLVLFTEYFFKAINNRMLTPKTYGPIVKSSFDYIPGNIEKRVDVGGKRVVVITDSEDKQTNLGRMMEQLKLVFAGGIEVINLHDIDIKGGCQGCIGCWYDNKCVYQDEYITFVNTKVMNADAIIFAGTVTARYFSAKHKQFWDRFFFNHHKLVFEGMQISAIVSGPESQIPFLHEIFHAMNEAGHANYIRGVCDECENSAEIDAAIQSLAERIVLYAEKRYVRPPTFLGAGGLKILRDHTWGRARFILQDDHRFLKENGLYDFPQKDYKTRLINMILIPLTRIPAFRREFTKKMKSGMIMAHQKVLKSM